MPDEPSTRERILRVASDLFAESGFHATTTREIAERVGIRQPGLFHHFSSKDEIMRELQALDFAASHQAMESASKLDLRPAVALAVALVVDTDRLLKSPYSFGSTLQPAVFNDPAFAQGRDRYQEGLRWQTELIRRGVEAGDFVDVDPELATSAVEWLIDGMLIDSARRPSAVVGDQLVDIVVSFALRALVVAPNTVGQIIAEARQVAFRSDADA